MVWTKLTSAERIGSMAALILCFTNKSATSRNVSTLRSNSVLS